MWHYSTVLETTGVGIGRLGLPGLVPRSERRRFFGRMHQDFVRYRPGSYRHPPGARGVKLRLVERNAYLTYSLLEPLNQLRVALRPRRTMPWRHALARASAPDERAASGRPAFRHRAQQSERDR